MLIWVLHRYSHSQNRVKVPERSFMSKHLFHDTAVEVNDHRHREHVAAHKYARYKQLRIESVGQVVE